MKEDFIVSVFTRCLQWQGWLYAMFLASFGFGECSLAEDELEHAAKNVMVTPSYPHAVRFGRFMPDGERVLVGRRDGNIEVRSLPVGKQLAILQPPLPHADTFEVSPDGAVIAASNCDSGTLEIRVWDAKTLRPLEPIGIMGKKLYGFAFSPDGNLIAIGARDDKPDANDDTVVVWDLKKKAVRKLLQGDTGAATCLAFSSNGYCLACGGEDRWVDMWRDPNDFVRDYLRGVQGNSLQVACIAFLPEHARSGGEFSNQGIKSPHVVISGSDRAIRVFQYYTNEEIMTLRGHRGGVGTLLTLPGDRLISGSGDHTIRVWDVGAARELAMLRLDSGVLGLSLSPDGETMLSVESSLEEEKVRFWRVSALLRARGEIKPEDCERWRGEWKSVPADEKEKGVGEGKASETNATSPKS